MGVVFSVQTRNWLLGMGSGLFAGVLFATFFTALFTMSMRWFVARQAKEFANHRPDFGGEVILMEGPANHLKGVEGVGGYLWLTSGQLFFRSHRFNVQNHEYGALLSEIAGAEATMTLGTVPKGLLVHLISGSQEKFVVHQNNDWAAAILNAKTSQEKLLPNQDSKVDREGTTPLDHPV